MHKLLRVFVCLGLIPTTSWTQDKPPPPARPIRVASTDVAPADSTCDNVSPNLVANCGFESGDFNGWVVTGDLAYSGVADFAADSGAYGSYWGSIGNQAFLSQTIDTDSSQTYQLWFSLKDTSDPDPSTTGSTYFEARWNGTSLVTLQDSSAFDWRGYCFNVTPEASGSSLLRFVFRHDPAYFYLDDVMLIPSSDPCPSS